MVIYSFMDFSHRCACSMILTLIGTIKDEKDLDVCVKNSKKYLILLQEVILSMN